MFEANTGVDGFVPRALHGEVVFVTGAGRGLGRSIALQFARERCKIAVVDRDFERARSVSREAESLGATAICVEADVAVPEQVSESVMKVEAELGPVTVLVSNAAGNIRGNILDLEIGDWKETIDTTLRPTYLYSKAIIPGMLALGRGRVFIVGSVLGLTPKLSSPAYSAAKAGLANLAQSLRIEFGPSGIEVTTVIPGAIDTPWFDDRPEIDRELLLDPQQIAWTIVQIAKLTSRASVPEIVFQPRNEIPPLRTDGNSG